MQFTLKIWRQPSQDSTGIFEKHIVDNVTADMSFFEIFKSPCQNETRFGYISIF